MNSKITIKKHKIEKTAALSQPKEKKKKKRKERKKFVYES